MWEGTHAQAGFTHGMAHTRPLGFFDVEGVGFGRDGWEADRCGDARLSDAPCPALDPLREFLDEGLDRETLMQHWNDGWDTCLRTVRTLRAGDLGAESRGAVPAC